MQQKPDSNSKDALAIKKRKVATPVSKFAGESSKSPIVVKNTHWLSSELPQSYSYMQKQKLARLELTKSSISYAPWSKEKLLSRLATYNVRNWDIPSGLDQISALQCAKFGWIALDPDSNTQLRNRVQCVTCHMIFFINIGTDIDVQKIMADRYHSMLKTQHTSSCPWVHNWCKDNIYTINLVKSQLIEAITQRYQSLVRLRDKFAVVTLVTEPQVDRDVIAKMYWVLNRTLATSTKYLDTEIVEKKFQNHDIPIPRTWPPNSKNLENNIMDSSIEASDVNTITSTPLAGKKYLGVNCSDKDTGNKFPEVDYNTFILALTGWKLDYENGNKGILASCDMCFRKLFIIADASKAIDIVNEHFCYCPYRVSKVIKQQENDESNDRYREDTVNTSNDNVVRNNTELKKGWYKIYEAVAPYQNSSSYLPGTPIDMGGDADDEKESKLRSLRVKKLMTLYRHRHHSSDSDLIGPNTNNWSDQRTRLFTPTPNHIIDNSDTISSNDDLRVSAMESPTPDSRISNTTNL